MAHVTTEGLEEPAGCGDGGGARTWPPTTRSALRSLPASMPKKNYRKSCPYVELEMKVVQAVNHQEEMMNKNVEKELGVKSVGKVPSM